jgi:hypothetical protein
MKFLVPLSVLLYELYLSDYLLNRPIDAVHGFMLLHILKNRARSAAALSASL